MGLISLTRAVFGTRWYCPMCGGQVPDREKPCPHCRYDPYKMLRDYDAYVARKDSQRRLDAIRDKTGTS